MTCTSLNSSFYTDPSRISYEDEDEIGRRRREGEKKGKGKQSKGRSVRKPMKISCQTPNVECFMVECEALFFKPTFRTLVEFRLRLLTETARKAMASTRY